MQRSLLAAFASQLPLKADWIGETQQNLKLD